MEIKITLTEAEAKAMTFVALSAQEWAENAIKNRARIAMQELFDHEVQRMIADPNVEEIPADIEQVVLNAVLPVVDVDNEHI